MTRILAALLCAFILASPAFPQTRQSPAGANPPVLRVMGTGQFSRFLKRLDADVLKWKARLRNVDVASLGVDSQERKEIERSYNLCLEALDNTREDIRKLSRDQTVKLDFLLLIDLNALARNLDGLSVNLASPVTLQKTSTAKKSLGWAREVLDIDAELASHMTEFQHHLLALAGLLDAALESAEQGAGQPKDHN